MIFCCPVPTASTKPGTNYAPKFHALGPHLESQCSSSLAKPRKSFAKGVWHLLSLLKRAFQLPRGQTDKGNKIPTTRAHHRDGEGGTFLRGLANAGTSLSGHDNNNQNEISGNSYNLCARHCASPYLTESSEEPHGLWSYLMDEENQLGEVPAPAQVHGDDKW